MEAEKQVCTLKDAKRLNELGIEQYSLFYWKINEVQTNVCDLQFKEMCEKYLPLCNEYISAFTVAELGIMLGPLKMNLPLINNIPEAIKRAAYLIKLLETGKITADEVNQNLKS